VPATAPANGLKATEQACIESHINTLTRATQAENELILVFEDDFELCDDFDNELQKCLSELPANWNGLWLGGRVKGLREPYSENLVRITATSGSFGYLVKKSFVPALLYQLNKRNMVADWAKSRAFKNVFRSKKNLVKHRYGYSYIQNKHVQYPDLR
jgi:GR25 family glycosyltransferase involved in LPS biosynthesis